MMKQTARRNGMGCGKGNAAAVEKHAMYAAERKAASELHKNEIDAFYAAHPEFKR